ncbi:MAG: acyl-CoA dehydrogenase family protein [Longimicrobiales bacterium]
MAATPTPSPTPTYDFSAYLDRRSADWYEDDPLLHRLLDRYAPGADRGRLAAFGPRAAGELRALAETSARPENAPWIRHRNAYDDRLDELVFPASTLEALRISHGDEGLGAVRGDPFVHYAMIYLLAQNGEAGVACSLACTDGLVRALEAAADGAHGFETRDLPDPLRSALDGVLGSSADGYVHGAQFVTEIQGGSDVPANTVRAVPDGHAFRIHGQKWFCSNINADWFLVTAKPVQGPAADGSPADGSPGEGAAASRAAETAAGRADAGALAATPVGLFLVPAFLDGARNGYTIDRLKDKLGTRALATAEVTFDGARAWPVGPLERGLPNLLRYVLTPSRFACSLFAASTLRRAERIIGDYAGFREAFGRSIARYPLVQRTMRGVVEARRRSLVVVFELLRLWEAAEEDGYRGEAALDFRILLSLAKPVLTRLATEQLHEAMMVLAGNGIEERFSSLPRLHRDSIIMETWEGPHNVLFTQALRDFQKYDLDPAGFLERVTGGPRPELARDLAAVMAGEAGEAGDRDDGGGHEVDPTVAMADLAPAIIAAVALGRGKERGPEA